MMKLHILILITIIGVVQVSDAKKVMFCYWGSWSTYRLGMGNLEASHIDPNTCTHLIYAFAGLNHNNEIYALDAWNDLPRYEAGGGKDNYRKLISLKNSNPNLKVLLTIGGYNEGSTKFSSMASFAAYRKTFVNSVVNHLRRYGFDGLDLAWQWPTERGGIPSDKENYVELLKELRTALNAHNLMLTIAAPGSTSYANKGYNLPEIVRNVDYLNVYAYDYQPSGLIPGSSLYYPRNWFLSVNYTIQYYLNNGVPANKLVLGVSLYGQAHILSKPDKHNIGDPSGGRANPGPFTKESGILSWLELCSKLQYEEFTVVNEDQHKCTYAYNTQEWVAYESEFSLQNKVNYLGNNNLGGIIVWSLENDDIRGACGPSRVSFIKDALDRL